MRSVSIFARSILARSNFAWGIAPVLAVLALAGTPSAPANGDDLHQAQTIVTGEREETRLPGFAECLEYVLVKGSGDTRRIGYTGVAALAGVARSFARDIRYLDR